MRESLGITSWLAGVTQTHRNPRWLNRSRLYLFWKVHFFKFCRKIPPQRRPRICRPVPAQPDRLPVRRLWHAIATRLPHPPRTRASSAQPCSTLPGCSTNPRVFGPSLNSMQKPPPATFSRPPVCAFCRTQPRLTACYFCTHPRPLCLWTSSASPCSTLSDCWTNTGVRVSVPPPLYCITTMSPLCYPKNYDN